ncbi:MAG TPA: HlyD family efflux transporter periplasmic adaptor subunit [Trebonia sp.]
MSAATSAEAAELGGATGQDTDGGARQRSGPRHRRRRMALAGGMAVVLTAGGGGAAWAAGAFRADSQPPSGVADNAYPTALATVTLGSLSSQQQVSATLGYAGSYSALNQAAGVYTQLPTAGQVVRRGQVLYQVNGDPVVLLYGSVPVYRPLSEGMAGADVRQLNANLVALGYATSSELDPASDYFSAETAYALELYQDHLGITETGSLALGQAVFLSSAARVTTIIAQLGAQAGPGSPVLQATSTKRQVSIALDASEQSYVRDGDKVSITLPDNQTTPGVVSYVGNVATTPPSSGGTSSTPVITVDVTPSDPAATGHLDQAPVQVSITTATVSGVLIVPVDALVSLAGGGYAVEVVEPGGTHEMVAVTLGLFDDAGGTVQASGAGLHAGQHVVVPAL